MGSASSNIDQSESCSNCDLKFTRMARRNKRICLECQSFMCSACFQITTDALPGGGKLPRLTRRLITGYCVSCKVMLAGDSSDQLTGLKVKHLKGFLLRRDVTEVNQCVEKKDLVELILLKVDSPSYRQRVEQEAGRTAELLARRADLSSEHLESKSPATSQIDSQVGSSSPGTLVDPVHSSSMNRASSPKLDAMTPSEAGPVPLLEVDPVSSLKSDPVTSLEVDPVSYFGMDQAPSPMLDPVTLFEVYPVPLLEAGLASSGSDPVTPLEVDSTPSSLINSSTVSPAADQRSSKIDTPFSSGLDSSPSATGTSCTQEMAGKTACYVEANQRVHPAEDSSSTPSVVDSPTVNVTHSGNTDSGLSLPRTVAGDTKQSSDSLSKISLSEIESVSEVDNLSVKQLKIILTRNLVTYKGCKEKHELISKVKMLWQARQDNEKLYQKLLNPQVSEDGTPTSHEEPELCKICMDSAIDCVLLDCGHMVSCTKCGKQMNECPICRQFVIRAVHIFRA
ncbi:uncharacterized protein [Watersipora subatra]|uniref:uncharacterized protein n=1 Tax=Watersipora subatra TaxID=2589382 RepID=UPI00355B61C5